MKHTKLLKKQARTCNKKPQTTTKKLLFAPDVEQKMSLEQFFAIVAAQKWSPLMTLLEVHEKMSSNKTLVTRESKRDPENANVMFAEIPQPSTKTSNL
jgi:hypothetical protein